MKQYRDIIKAAQQIALNEEKGKGIDHHVGNAFNKIKKVVQREREIEGGSAPSLTTNRKEYGGKSAAQHISKIAREHHAKHAAEVGHSRDEKEFTERLDNRVDGLF